MYEIEIHLKNSLGMGGTVTKEQLHMYLKLFANRNKAHGPVAKFVSGLETHTFFMADVIHIKYYKIEGGKVE
jgi:hypothetical protein